MFDDLFKTNGENNNKEKSETRQFKKHTSKKKKINLFKEIPDKKPIDVDKVNFRNEVAIVLYDNKELNDEVKYKFKKILDLLNKNNFKIRLLCINSNPILPVVKEIYDKDNVTIVKPWAKYCSVNDFRIWLPSSINIENAANYVNNFDKLPTGIKYIKSAYMTLLTSYTGKDFVKYVLVYDPFNNGKNKLDYNKSKDTFDLYRILKNLDILSYYNIDNLEELKAFVKLISK